MVLMQEETATNTSENPAHPLMTPVFPRFTPQEAMILNIVASAYPNFVTADNILSQLKKTMVGHPGWFGPTRQSLLVQIGNIRAKIGEQKRKPKRLITIYNLTGKQGRPQIEGWAWRG